VTDYTLGYLSLSFPILSLSVFVSRTFNSLPVKYGGNRRSSTPKAIAIKNHTSLHPLPPLEEEVQPEEALFAMS
jgi:hypothetical protein